MGARSSKVKPKETAEVWSPGESGRASTSDRELEHQNEVARAAGLAAGEGNLSASVAWQGKPACSSGNLHYEVAAPPPLDPAPPEGALTSPALGLDATPPPSPPPSPPPTETGKLWHTSRELDKAATQAEEAEAKMAALRVSDDAVTVERPAKSFGSCGISSPAELTVSAQEFTAAELRAAGYSKEELDGAGVLSGQGAKPPASSPSTEAELQAEAEAMRAQLRAARAAKAGGGKRADGGDAPKASNNADTRTCAGCGELLFGAAGSEAVEAAGKMWHSDCFVCAACGKPIDGDFAMLHGKPLHTACHLKDYGVHCAGCGRLIDGRADPGFVVAGDKSYHSTCFKCAECGVSLASGAPYHLVAGAAYCKLHDRRRKITRDKLKVNSTTGEEYYVEAGTGRKYRHAPTADGRGGKEYFEGAAPPALGGASTWRQDAS